MAIGRTFQESLHKALRGLETGMDGLDEVFDLSDEDALAELRKELGIARPERLWQVADGFRAGMTMAELAEITAIDPWFLVQVRQLIDMEQQLSGLSLDALAAPQRGAASARDFPTAALPSCSTRRPMPCTRDATSSA